MIRDTLRFLLLACAAVAATAACGPSESARRAAPSTSSEPIWSHQASDLPPDPAVRYGRLENGLRYAILENDTPTNTAAVRLHFGVGSLNEAEDQRGLAHFLEHMAFNGSENVEEGDMVKILERHGLAFGPDTNAFTSFDQTVYQLDLPDTGDETLSTGFMLMRELSDKLLIASDAVDRERGVVLAEHRSSNTFGFRYTKAQWRFLFPEALFPQRFPVGEADVLETAPRDRIADLWRRRYAPDNALLVFVGDADADAIEARITTRFGDWDSRADPSDPDPGRIDADRGLETGFFHDPDMPTVITLNFVTPAAEVPDTAEQRRLRLLRSIGFGALNRRFQRLARDSDSVIVSGSASFSRFYDTADMASVSVVADPEDWEAALAVGEQELRRALDHGFSESEIAEQVSNIRAGVTAAADSADTRPSTALANGLVGAFNDAAVFTHPRSNLERFNAFADDIAPAAVQAQFRRAFDGLHPLVFLATNREIYDAEAKIAAAYAVSRSSGVEAPEAAGSTKFAYSDFGPGGKVVDRDFIEDLGISRVRFANNVRLNIKSTDFEDELVRLSVRFGGGRLEMPKARPGLEIFTDSSFVSGGLQAHSLDELQSLLAGRNVGVSFSVGGDAFGFSASTTPADLDLQLKVNAAYFAAPGYRDEAVAQFQRFVEVWYETLDASPGSVAAVEVPRLIRSGDPRWGVPAKAELLAFGAEDLRAALANAIQHGAIEIGVVGDVDVDSVIAAVAETFGALPARAAEPTAFDQALPLVFPAPSATPIELEHQGEADKALALTYWPAFDDRDGRRTATLNLLDAVMGLKLIERVRETDSATYSPSASSFASSVHPGYGYVAAQLELKPDDIDAYFDVVDEIAAAMAAGDVSDDETERARRPILEGLEDAQENNGYWLGLVAQAQTDDVRLDRHRTAKATLESVTRGDVVAMAAELLRPDAAYRVAVRPANEAGRR